VSAVVYSIDELKRKVAPIAARYDLPAVYIFGSYARNEATEDSDVDILIDGDGSGVKSLFDMGGLYHDLRESLRKEIDIVTVQGLEQEKDVGAMFIDNVINDGVILFERA
jgi:predicted nucleotidyltransferase